MPKFEITLRCIEEKTYTFTIEGNNEDDATNEALKLISNLNIGKAIPSQEWEEELDSSEWELEDCDEL